MYVFYLWLEVEVAERPKLNLLKNMFNSLVLSRLHLDVIFPSSLPTAAVELYAFLTLA